jgi:hypothetical protein
MRCWRSTSDILASRCIRATSSGVVVVLAAARSTARRNRKVWIWWSRTFR